MIRTIKYLVFTLLMLVLLGTGCLELLITTQIWPNGSANRVFTVYLDFGDQGSEFQREMSRPFTIQQSFFYSTFKRLAVAELVELRKYSRDSTIIWEEEYYFPDINICNRLDGIVMFNIDVNASWEKTEYQGRPVYAYRESWWLLQESEKSDRESARAPYPLAPDFPPVTREQRESGLVRPFVASSIGTTDRFDLTMPGDIIATNADRYDGRHAVWLFGARLTDRHMWAICEREP